GEALLCLFARGDVGDDAHEIAAAARDVEGRFARDKPVAHARRVGKCLLVLGGLAGCEDEIVLLPENARLLGPNEVEVAAADQVLLRPPEHCAERVVRSEEHTSELQSLTNLVCRLLLEKTNRTETRRQQAQARRRGRPGLHCAADPTARHYRSRS